MTFKIRNFICVLLSLILVFSTTCYAKPSDNIKKEVPLKPEGEVKNLNNPQDVYKEEFKGWYIEAYKQAQRNAKSRGIELLDMNVALEEVLSGSGNNNSKNLYSSSHTNSSLFDPVHSSLIEAHFKQGEKYWANFRCREGNGEYNLYSYGNNLDLNAKVYTKNKLGNHKLYRESKKRYDGVNFDLNGPYKNRENGYYMEVERPDLNTSGKFMIHFSPNQDRTYSDNGGSWTPGTIYEDPDGPFISIDKVTYLTPSQAMALYITIANDEILEMRDWIVDLSAKAAITYLSGVLGISEKVATALFFMLNVPVFSPPTLTELELDALQDAAGGMIKTDGGDTFANGIRVVSMTTYTTVAPGVLKPVMMNVYEPHLYDVLRGPALYRGTFDLNDRTPLWR